MSAGHRGPDIPGSRKSLGGLDKLTGVTNMPASLRLGGRISFLLDPGQGIVA